MKKRISKRTVDAIKPSDRDTFLWDTDVSGFGLKVTPAGKRVYILQYRQGARKAPWRYTIGPHGQWAPEQARREAQRLRGLIAKGENPVLDRQARKGDGTVADVAATFMDEHVRARRKDRTVAEYQRLFDKLILPRVGRLPIKDVTRHDVARVHHALRDTPYQANRVIALLSKLMNWAELKGYRSDNSNPCRHVERNEEDRRERFLSGAELAALGKAMAKAESKDLASPYAIAAIRLLVLTGARLNEILTLKWDEVNFERSRLKLADSKTGRKAIYLSAAALEVLHSMPRVEGNPYVIVGHKTGSHLVNIQKPWQLIRGLAKLDDLRIHDLRHSYASVGAASGMSLPIIGALLGHSQPATTARYAHLADDPLRAAGDRIAGQIAAAMRGEDSEVERMRK
jgi:integrase